MPSNRLPDHSRASIYNNSSTERDNMAWRIGVDIGGTFTDIALVEELAGTLETTAAVSSNGHR